MKDRIELALLLADGAAADRLGVFALLTLGIVESLANGALGTNDAVRILFHADNGRSVRKMLRDRTADEITSRGVHLPDFFDALPEDGGAARVPARTRRPADALPAAVGSEAGGGVTGRRGELSGRSCRVDFAQSCPHRIGRSQ
jgi:hypothetical protein